MTVNGGDITYASDVNQLLNRPGAVLPTSFSFTTGSLTQITGFGAALWNVGSVVSGDTIVVPAGEGGLWDCGMVLRFPSQATAAGQRNGRVYVNGTEYMGWTIPAPSNLNSTNVPVWGNIPIVLAAGDVITFYGFQNSGVTQALVGNSRCWARRIA